MVPLALDELKCDFYAGNCHKWLLAPTGSGFLYLGEGSENRLQPLQVSWGYHPDHCRLDERDEFGSTPRLRFLEFEGSREMCPWLAVPQAINFQATIGWERIRIRNEALAEYTRQRLGAVPGLTLHTPVHPELHGFLTAFRLPPHLQAQALRQILWQRHRIEVPVVERPDGLLIRVSTHFYNTETEIDRLAEALSRPTCSERPWATANGSPASAQRHFASRRRSSSADGPSESHPPRYLWPCTTGKTMRSTFTSCGWAPAGAGRHGHFFRLFAKEVLQKGQACDSACCRAPGVARDWDVFRETLAERQQHVPARAGRAATSSRVMARPGAVAAQAELETIAAKGPDFERLAAATIDAVRQPRGRRRPQMLRDLARPWLAGILAELDAVASGDVQQYDHLHKVRILGKRLRYGMEVFAPCFGAKFKTDLYPQIEEMQEILGCANDSHVADQRLAALRDLLAAGQPAPWQRFRPGVEGLLHYHQRRLSEQLKHFQRWWMHWRKSGADAALLGMLKPTKGPASAAFG